MIRKFLLGPLVLTTVYWGAASQPPVLAVDDDPAAQTVETLFGDVTFSGSENSDSESPPDNPTATPANEEAPSAADVAESTDLAPVEERQPKPWSGANGRANSSRRGSAQLSTEPLEINSRGPSTGDEAKADSRDNRKSPPDAKLAAPSEAELTPELRNLRQRVRRCLAAYYFQPESTNDLSPWGVMHALIAYGVDTQILVNDQKINACSFLAGNGMCRGLQLMQLDQGNLSLRIGPGVQGHAGQFLSILAQSRIQRTYPLYVGNREFTIEDLIEYEKATCRTKTELTFKLIGLSHYLDSNSQWKANDGQDWSISRLVKEELAQPVIGAACGGTHRLTGLTYAVRQRERQGQPLDGQWLRARKYLDAYHDYTFSLQNPDGTFSTDWFRGPSNWGDDKRRLETTGHILEWLVLSLPKEQLSDARVVRAVSYLTDMMLRNANSHQEIGPKGHALHALALYDERLFGLTPGNRVAVYVSELRKGNVQETRRDRQYPAR